MSVAVPGFESESSFFTRMALLQGCHGHQRPRLKSMALQSQPSIFRRREQHTNICKSHLCKNPTALTLTAHKKVGSEEFYLQVFSDCQTSTPLHPLLLADCCCGVIIWSKFVFFFIKKNIVGKKTLYMWGFQHFISEKNCAQKRTMVIIWSELAIYLEPKLGPDNNSYLDGPDSNH